MLSLGLSIFIHVVAHSNVLFFLDSMELVFCILGAVAMPWNIETLTDTAY